MIRFLLPPSESKRDGGDGGPLRLAELSFSSLTDARTTVLAALENLSESDEAARRALKLSVTSAPAELARNRTLRSSPTTPAIERYTGVLYDALAPRDWPSEARARASDHVVIHSALFGLLGANDHIPAYRFSHNSRIAQLRLKAEWASCTTAVLDGFDGPIVDLRSEGYAALGPLPDRDDAVYVRVIAVGDDGVARALNHFNKKGKGEFIRAVLTGGPLPETLDELCQYASRMGWPLRRSAARQLELTVPGVVPSTASSRAGDRRPGQPTA